MFQVVCADLWRLFSAVCARVWFCMVACVGLHKCLRQHLEESIKYCSCPMVVWEVVKTNQATCEPEDQDSSGIDRAEETVVQRLFLIAS